MCGGTQPITSLAQVGNGLSPRVRGNPRPGRSWGHGHRSIPACAGEPRFVKAIKHNGGVYPRVCGGTFVGTAAAGFEMGLSPRVRGNR